MKLERILITGCGGMLGSAVYPYFASRYKEILATDKTTNEEWIEHLDVRDNMYLSKVFKEFKPDIVLHLAAETDLEYCETHPDISEETNSHATKFIAKLCEKHNALLVYISTAGVFDGLKSSFYTEADQPNPIMIYGQTKYNGELNAIENCSKTFVVRAGWMIGGGRTKEKKFIYKILQQLLEGKKEIFAVDDLRGTPTYAYDFAMNLFKLIRTEKYGLYHMACEGQGNRYDVAKAILEICGRTDIKLTRVDSDFFKEEYFVVRPRSEMLINEQLSKIGLNHMRPWREALINYIENYFFDFMNPLSSERVERRMHYRRICEIAIYFSRESEMNKKVYSGLIVNMGVSGIGFMTDIPLEPGQAVLFWNKEETTFSPRTSIVQHTKKIGDRYIIGLNSPQVNIFALTDIFMKKGNSPSSNGVR